MSELTKHVAKGIDPVTFTEKPMPTEFPQILVDKLCKTMQDLPDNLLISPMLYEPNLSALYWAVLEKDDKEMWVNKYGITIKLNKI